jgi:hypothetical protein
VPKIAMTSRATVTVTAAHFQDPPPAGSRSPGSTPAHMGDNSIERQCICRDAVMKAKENRRERAQPWILLKSSIALTLAIVGYTSYVYIARLCVPMILRRSGALGSREIGSKSSCLCHPSESQV